MERAVLLIYIVKPFGQNSCQGISLGRDFRSELQKTLSACDSMLVLIDKDWAAVKDEKGQIRLENAGDFVRMEIEAGLKRDIAVTPILVKGAQMPAAEELPAEIRDLAYRNCFELSYTRWESDVREMIRRLGLDVPERGGQVETDRRPIASGEAGGGSVPAGAKPRVGQQRQAAVDDRRRRESRPVSFVQAAAAERADTAETTSPPTARQPSRKPLVIAGVLGVICLGGVVAWLAYPSAVDAPPAPTIPQAAPVAPPTVVPPVGTATPPARAGDTRFEPAINVEINFEYNSDTIGPRAVPVLLALCKALSSPELAGSTFVIAGHTDGRGGDAFSQRVSERLADAVKRYLVEKCHIDASTLITVGYGKTRLKNEANPTAQENRRVVILNKGPDFRIGGDR